jgi:hypothetical protein
VDKMRFVLNSRIAALVCGISMGVLVLSQVAVRVDQASAVHTRCAHGELVHASAGGVSDGLRIQADESPSGHDHCELAHLWRKDARKHTPPRVEAHAPYRPRTMAQAPEVRIVSDLLRVAPKNSPPA